MRLLPLELRELVVDDLALLRVELLALLAALGLSPLRNRAVSWCSRLRKSSSSSTSCCFSAGKDCQRSGVHKSVMERKRLFTRSRWPACSMRLAVEYSRSSTSQSDHDVRWRTSSLPMQIRHPLRKKWLLKEMYPARTTKLRRGVQYVDAVSIWLSPLW